MMLKTCALTALIALTAVGNATAADLAANLPAKAPYNNATYNWTGCYIGVHGGGGASENAWTNNAFAPLLGIKDFGSVRATGWLAGGQAGCDYQTGALVFGIEGQFSAADLRGQGAGVAIGTNAVTLNSRVDRLATGTARIGYAFDRALPYIKGGLAWVHDGQHGLDAMDSISGKTLPLFAGDGRSVFGWTAGAGVEVAFHPNWSWKVEYNYIDLGTNSLTLSCALACGAVAVSGPFEIKQSIQTVVMGINYRFQ